jgi:hypothetical protein
MTTASTASNDVNLRPKRPKKVVDLFVGIYNKGASN